MVLPLILYMISPIRLSAGRGALTASGSLITVSISRHFSKVFGSYFPVHEDQLRREISSEAPL